MSFQSLNLADELNQALAQLEFTEPTQIQALSIPLILEGKDLLATAQTGTGKTAAFMLPILNTLLQSEFDTPAVRALVLAPTRELAQQVAKDTKRLAKFSHLKVACLYGGANIGPQEKILKEGVDIVIATPGRLLDHMIKGTLSLNAISHLVFDEADRMLDMGFIGEIKRIMRKMPESRQTMLFSATMDESVLSQIKMWLNTPERVGVEQQNSTADKVEQTFYAVDEDRKRELISHLIGKNNWQQVLVFTRTKKSADEYASELNKDGLATLSIHGDKSQGARERALEQFKSGKTRVLVATDVAARGIDIKALNYVINVELPYVAEDYIHRIGRTGRAGNSGQSISLVSIDEQWLLEEIEVLLDTRLTPQWLPGYEPDLTKEPKDDRKNSAKSRKQRDKKRILGQRTRRRKK
ncbi:DEAD/DEAH box helicase [Pseudoalteromonas luteoviolacea]|uniref:DEAD/DEAH box helicase n=1 Tax=Pseudoalteromonas luteoviolacea S4054 TaxID=1129367 RepID=A0A0F6A3U1_9GAMM|nr:DEAD/DEAH box helicase [Pseudoalteromonas luteoviolacea]AOT08925.1 DEAD/DEAH box helicase [Pseudoalteromonas luteoviolacea]AOT13837.1 DEAD/DEAH box helicase [Pseudoalteromonas luteoviolacea]AOT18752.1 DEAD/DEAH box helicase [Pseudoalteromonas luteoviolacea]KKE80875.1 DEAD/DEAH box helicase [Pseudoalteromonas luteoviolacea S4054]KZN70991.1 DEAD/DEAH box helicase [Pseudoalteromonas luteoviolacea S4047-1]